MTGHRASLIIGKTAEPDLIQHDRQRHHGAHCEEHESDDADRERERQRIELEEAALLLFAIDDVERVDQRFDAGVGAP